MVSARGSKPQGEMTVVEGQLEPGLLTCFRSHRLPSGVCKRVGYMGLDRNDRLAAAATSACARSRSASRS